MLWQVVGVDAGFTNQVALTDHNPKVVATAAAAIHSSSTDDVAQFIERSSE